MKKSIFLEYGVHNFDVSFLKKVKEAGFDGVDFCFNGKLFEDGKDEEIVDTIKQNIENAGLFCAQVHLPWYDIFASSELYDDVIEKNIKMALKHMKTLGAKWGAFHPLSSSNFSYDRKRALKDNIEKIKGYLEVAEKYDVGIAVENLPVFPDCPQYKFFTSKVEDHIELIEKLDSEHIGVCWDFGHANLNMEDNDKAGTFSKICDKVKILHVNDNHGMEDRHLCPGIGSVNWQEQLNILFGSGFEGVFSLECNIKPDNEDIAIAYIECMAKTADSLLSQVKNS